jgi:hypothetical protein
MQEMLQDWQRYLCKDECEAIQQGQIRRGTYDGIGSVLQRPGVEMAGGSWVEWFYGTDCCDRMDGCESCRWGL